jgi:hypothetical protein
MCATGKVSGGGQVKQSTTAPAEKTSRHRKILQTGQTMPQSRLVQSPWHANCTDDLQVPGSHNKTVKNVCTTSGIDSQEDEEQDNEEGFDP